MSEQEPKSTAKTGRKTGALNRFAKRQLAAWLAALGNLKYGRLLVVWADGSQSEFIGAEKPGAHGALSGEMVIHDARFFRRVLAGGSLGFAESYMQGEWSTPNLEKLLEVLVVNLNEFEAKLGQSKLFHLIQRLIHFLRPNTRRGARKNIHAHYDLGNEFYRLWLDPSMTYSSARFTGENMSLQDAQREKYKSLARLMDIQKHHHILEIGCGWGGFAEYAAGEIGCQVTGITISREQLAFAQKRMADKGLGDKVDLQFRDYRDVTEKFDRIASIEMFEAVGERYWPAYFSQIKNCLKPDGRAGLQIITINDASFATYRKRTDFIQKYIFPGGMLPSPARLSDEFHKARLTLRDKIDFGDDYAQTLNKWHGRFTEQWAQIASLGFDEIFKRMWSFYLTYCAVGFRAEHINVSQFILENAPASASASVSVSSSSTPASSLSSAAR